MSLDLVGACDVADMVRLEALTTDNDTPVGGHRVAEVNMVRDRRANISQFYGGEWKESQWSRNTSIGVTKTWEPEFQPVL